MSDDEIDLERVVSDPSYRREVIAFLKMVDGATAESSPGFSDSDDQPRP